MNHIVDHFHGTDFSGELSPEAKKIIQLFEPENPDSVRAADMDIAQARSVHGLAAHDIALPEPSSKVSEKIITSNNRDIRIRIYNPPTENEEKFPLFVFAHGGCWTFCSLDSHDRICHYISHHSRCIVVSVDYALAPEHPFPAGLNDYCDAILWCAEHAELIGADHTKIAVGGDSAGGNLATVAAQKLLAESGLTICLQVLIYPICQVPAPPSTSLTRYAKGYFFTSDMLEFTSSLYIQSPLTQESIPLVSPISGIISPSLAPAFFVIAECDILRDQALAYAEKLKAAGIPVTCNYYLGMPHAFIAMAGSLPLGHHALDDCVQQISQAFQGISMRPTSKLFQQF
jgi:acetyl esterase